jgi:hypothetical protein
MSTIDDIISRWVSMIDYPIVINKKQGFVLNNGTRILLEESGLSHQSQDILSRHYAKKRSK